MKVGFLFPGQGSQIIGMGKDIYDEYPEVRRLYRKVDELTGLSVEEISFTGTEQELNKTKNTQICILTMSLAILEILKKYNIRSENVAGLSFGEYSALIYGGSLTIEDGVKIVKTRGELMQNLCPKGEWSMAAVIGIDEETVERVCKSLTSGFVEPANYNCTGQVVISGDKKTVQEVSKKMKQEGAKKVIEIKTAGPFHTEKLKEASIELRKKLSEVKVDKPKINVFKNLDGGKYSEKDNMKELLAKHIISPVKFSKCIENMLKEGVDTFIEIGPGKALTGFVKRANKDVKLYNINSLKSLQELIEEGRN